MFGGKNSFFNKPFGDKDDDSSAAGIFGKTAVGRLTGGSPSDKRKATSGGISPAQVDASFERGEEQGQRYVGAGVDEIGQERANIRGRYADIVNQPSRGSARVMDERNSALKSLSAQQAGSGVGGGLAAAQNIQTRANYAQKAGDVRQREYLEALNKLETQYRGAARDVAGMSGQRASIEIAGQPMPTMSQERGFMDTYICTKLKENDLISDFQLFFIHILFLVGILFRPVDTLVYLIKGKILADKLTIIDLVDAKNNMFLPVLALMTKFRFIKAIDLYIGYTKALARRKFVDIDYNYSWNLGAVFDCLKLIYNNKFRRI